MNRSFTIANAAGGDRKRFQLTADGRISDHAIRHARKLGRWATFDGPAASEASEFFDRNELERADCEGT